jgi:hypothetical protein
LSRYRAHKSRNLRRHQQRFTDPRGAGRKSDPAKINTSKFHLRSDFLVFSGSRINPEISAFIRRKTCDRNAAALPCRGHTTTTVRVPLASSLYWEEANNDAPFPPTSIRDNRRPRASAICAFVRVQSAVRSISPRVHDASRETHILPGPQRYLAHIILSPYYQQVHIVRLSVKHFFLENESV